MPHLPTSLSRRRLLGASASLTMLASFRGANAQDVTPTPPIAGTSLRVLMPRHPLAAYDDSIRNLATNWAAREQVSVSIDIVPGEDIPATFDAELQDGAGHDLIMADMPMLHHASDLHDLAAFHDQLANSYGPPAEPCNNATRLADGRRPALSLAYAPAPLIYRRSVWERYGLPEGPATWDQLHETGSQIWHEDGMNVGFGLSREPGSERFASMLITAFGGMLLDANGEIAINSPQTIDAVRFGANLYRDTMSPESLEWRTDRPARLLADGIASIICDDLTALRLAQTRNQEVAHDLFLAPPPLGPGSGQIATVTAASYRAFHIPLFASNLDAARAFFVMLVESSAALVGASQLGDRPAYGSLVPGLVQDGGWLDADPYGANPPEKLTMLKSSAAWTTWPGAPGPANPLTSVAHAEFLLSRMMAQAARGDRSAEEALTEAETQLKALRDAG